MGCSTWHADTEELGFDFKHTVTFVVSCVPFYAWSPGNSDPNPEVQEFLTYILHTNFTLVFILLFYLYFIFALSLFKVRYIVCIYIKPNQILWELKWEHK